MVNTLVSRVLCVLVFMYLIFITEFMFAKELGVVKGGERGDELVDYKTSDVYEESSPGRKFPSILRSEGVQDYEESVFRRFDIIFFLALPIFFGYQFIIHEVVSSYYPVNNIRNNFFSVNQYIYIALSSVMLGLAVAYDDYRKVSIDGAYSSSYDSGENDRSIALALQFNF